ncbi:ubiquitin-like-conjugating enzyme ATG10 [Anabrus simplex]|uniref:ubiquitin-like-conjugating enzyme ATG10 n=1 Tax=Anabrus simplex TaxID=316456 RepID=UPI0034DCD9A6
MAGTVTWEEFLTFSQQIVKISDDICDGWRLEGSGDIPGSTYLVKKLVKPSSESIPFLKDTDGEFVEDHDFQINSASSTCSWEYHVLYCPSYSVPVLYFNAWKSDGCILGLEEMWTLCQEYFQGQFQEDKWNILSQKEHPNLRRPFFHLHPCRTAQLLSCIGKNSWNPLVTWLSSVGPSVGLIMPLAYSSLQISGNPDNR